MKKKKNIYMVRIIYGSYYSKLVFMERQVMENKKEKKYIFANYDKK